MKKKFFHFRFCLPSQYRSSHYGRICFISNFSFKSRPCLESFFARGSKQEVPFIIAKIYMVLEQFTLTLKAPITTAADDIIKYFFIVFQRK